MAYELGCFIDMDVTILLGVQYEGDNLLHGNIKWTAKNGIWLELGKEEGIAFVPYHAIYFCIPQSKSDNLKVLNQMKNDIFIAKNPWIKDVRY